MKKIKRNLVTVLLSAGIALSLPPSSVAFCPVSAAEEFSVMTESFAELENKPLYVDKEIQVYASASGGKPMNNNNYLYRFVYCSAKGGGWITVSDFSAVSSVSMSFAEAGTYYFKITARDSAGKETSANYVLHVYGENKNLSVVSAEGLIKGETLTISPIPETDIPYSDGYVYYKYKRNNAPWEEFYSQTLDDISVKFPDTGVYNLEVTPYPESISEMEARKFQIEVSPQFSCSIAEKEALSVYSIGEELTVRVVTTGGHYARAADKKFTYGFRWHYTGENEWHIISQNGNFPECTVKADWTDDVEIEATAVDEAGNITSDSVFCRKKAVPLTVSENIGVSNGTIKMAAHAEGGKQPYQYACYYRKQNASGWKTKAGFGTASAFTITPDTAGEYEICIKVRDSNGTVAKKYRTVTMKECLSFEGKLSSDTVAVGGSIAVTACAAGGAAPYQYTCLYADTSLTELKWITLSRFGAKREFVFSPKEAKPYRICIKAKDSDGTVVKKFFDVTVCEKLKNTSVISAAAIKKGNTVTLYGSAVGGMGQYTYAALYKKKSEAKWTVRQGYKENSEILVRPYTDTDYDICIKVKDQNGTVAKKYFNVSVTK